MKNTAENLAKVIYYVGREVNKISVLLKYFEKIYNTFNFSYCKFMENISNNKFSLTKACL